jgi:hypothetical protein
MNPTNSGMNSSAQQGYAVPDQLLESQPHYIEWTKYLT